MLLKIRDALAVVLPLVREHDYDDNPPSNSCPTCGWDSRKHAPAPGSKLGHLPGCALPGALRVLLDVVDDVNASERIANDD